MSATLPSHIPDVDFTPVLPSGGQIAVRIGTDNGPLPTRPAVDGVGKRSHDGPQSGNGGRVCCATPLSPNGRQNSKSQMRYKTRKKYLSRVPSTQRHSLLANQIYANFLHGSSLARKGSCLSGFGNLMAQKLSDKTPMTDPWEWLEAKRGKALQDLAKIADMRCGSITEECR
jgi:hypothetical protein